jgi:hypothetical protein
MNEVEKRDYHGYVQFRYPGDGWRFYISSFSMDGHTGHIAMTDGTLSDIRIGRKGGITVAGRYFGPKQWDH